MSFQIDSSAVEYEIPEALVMNMGDIYFFPAI